MHSRDFDAIAVIASQVPGWLTHDQARVLYDEAAAVPAGGCVVEIGSHHGRSTVVLAAAVDPKARVVAVDPFPADWRYGGPDTEQSFRATLAAAGVTDVVDVRVGTSAEVLSGWDAPVDVVYVDGKHDARSVCHDLRWGRWVPAGGHVLVHDAFSSVGVTLGLLWTLLTGRSLVYLDRTGSLARLRVGHPAPADRLRPLRELPWWLRNLAVKVLLRLRLRRVARWCGHTGEADPY